VLAVGQPDRRELAEVADDAGVSMIEPARRHGEQVLQPALRRR
jgi:hypothetical protein